jgi:hypothetical protein
MSHSVYLFAIPKGFDWSNTAALQKTTDAWLDQTDSHVSRSRVAKVKLQVKSLLAGEIPSPAADPWFEALLCLFRSHLEELPFGTLTEYREQSLPEQVGLIEPAGRVKAPLPVPVSKQVYPRVGYLPCKSLHEMEFHPESLVDKTALKSLEEDLFSVMKDLGIDDFTAEVRPLRQDVPEELLEEIRDDLSFTFNRIADEGGSVIFVAS